VIFGKSYTILKAAVIRYLSTIEGKNFVITNLIAEVADSYYELLALDNQLTTVKQKYSITASALENCKIQRLLRATELAVQKFKLKFWHQK
jgi:outer membrane protein TolC